MENILKTIKQECLLKAGDVVGVAVSGGSDSMALLHYLNSHKVELDIDVCAVHVDHSIREESADDAQFVMKYCRENGIRAYKFKVDVPKLVEKRKESVEKVARDARYGVFDALLKKDVIDKIVIAHNTKDQAETILLNLFRGAGIEGASGMNAMRDNVYIRPMLNTSKRAILDYIFINDIPYRDDKTNADNTYSRNYVRNLILPLIEEKWPGATQKIVNFGKDCAEDNAYINSQLMDDAIMYDAKTVQIPCSYFLYPNSIISRMIFRALKNIGITHDIERKHIAMVKDLALNGENGKKIRLTMGVTAYKEYDFVTLSNKKKEKILFGPIEYFKSGSFEVPEFGTVVVKRTKDRTLKKSELMIDATKIPEGAIWRLKERGDVFEKFGGGTKKLKDFLIDKKIPNRLRDSLPLLAVGKNVLVIAGVEIANSVKIDNNTQIATKISVLKPLKRG